jgi:hypothetical protein
MDPRIDFKTLKHDIPIDSVLQRYGVPTRKVNTIYLRCDCPLSSHTSKESKGSFSINTQLNLWCCKSDSCVKGSGKKGGDVLDLVMLMEGTHTALDAAKKLLEWFPQNGMAPAPNGTKPNGSGAVVVPSNPTSPAPLVNKPLAFELKGIAYCEYLEKRGITKETAAMFGVGFFPGKGSMAGRIVFPLFQHGALVGYIGRATLEGQEPKWLMPSGLVKSFLYGLDHCDAAKPLVLVESPWAVLWFSQNGVQAASLLGSDMTAAQQECLRPFHAITVALDNDDTGNEKATKIIERLKAAGHKVLKAHLVE